MHERNDLNFLCPGTCTQGLVPKLPDFQNMQVRVLKLMCFQNQSEIGSSEHQTRERGERERPHSIPAAEAI